MISFNVSPTKCGATLCPLVKTPQTTQVVSEIDDTTLDDAGAEEEEEGGATRATGAAGTSLRLNSGGVTGITARFSGALLFWPTTSIDAASFIKKTRRPSAGRTQLLEDAYVGGGAARAEAVQSEAVQSDENDGEVRLKTDTEGEMTCRSRPPELTGRMKAIEREKRFYER